ncbi:putative extensin [Iris pallida]|uniref:Extensin n=1 Tax=Iris pallida TaxID=29817 RepID=A0AAX6HQH9_IRIPA|nr:putative extensin [Iris pallida]
MSGAHAVEAGGCRFGRVMVVVVPMLSVVALLGSQVRLGRGRLVVESGSVGLAGGGQGNCNRDGRPVKLVLRWWLWPAAWRPEDVDNRWCGDW